MAALFTDLPWRYAGYGGRLLNAKMDEATVRKLTWHFTVRPIFYLADFAEPLG